MLRDSGQGDSFHNFTPSPSSRVFLVLWKDATSDDRWLTVSFNDCFMSFGCDFRARRHLSHHSFTKHSADMSRDPERAADHFYCIDDYSSKMDKELQRFTNSGKARCAMRVRLRNTQDCVNSSAVLESVIDDIVVKLVACFGEYSTYHLNVWFTLTLLLLLILQLPYYFMPWEETFPFRYHTPIYIWIEDISVLKGGTARTWARPLLQVFVWRYRAGMNSTFFSLNHMYCSRDVRYDSDFTLDMMVARESKMPPSNTLDYFWSSRKAENVAEVPGLL